MSAILPVHSWSGLHIKYTHQNHLVIKQWGCGGDAADFSHQKILTAFSLACSPKFAVKKIAPACCEPAFGKARLATLKCLWSFQLVFYGNFGRNVDFS